MPMSDIAKLVSFYGRFTPNYSRTGYLARSLRWPAFRPDLSGQYWVVTGASGGIGAAIVAGAARAGAQVLAVARSSDRLEAARRGLAAEVEQRIESRVCDLASVAAIDGLITSLRADGRPIDTLINNVGVLFNDMELTAEGFETTYVTNLLGHYQLTEAIFEAGLFGPEPTIVNMASGGLYTVPQTTKLLNITDANRYVGKYAYGAHKRAQVALSELWDQRLRAGDGRSYVMHPGWVRTEGVKKALPVFYKLQGLLLRNSAQGADTALWLAATRPEQSGRNIWFDRAVRPQHMFEHTRQPQCTDDELVAYLEADLARARGGRSEATAGAATASAGVSAATGAASGAA